MLRDAIDVITDKDSFISKKEKDCKRIRGNDDLAFNWRNVHIDVQTKYIFLKIKTVEDLKFW